MPVFRSSRWERPVPAKLWDAIVKAGPRGYLPRWCSAMLPDSVLATRKPRIEPLKYERLPHRDGIAPTDFAFARTSYSVMTCHIWMGKCDVPLIRKPFSGRARGDRASWRENSIAPRTVAARYPLIEEFGEKVSPMSVLRRLGLRGRAIAVYGSAREAWNGTCDTAGRRYCALPGGAIGFDRKRAFI